MHRICLFALIFSIAACTPPVPTQPLALTPSAAPPAAATTPATAASLTTAPADDLAPFRAAMKPGFAAEIDRFGTAPRYQIDLTIAPDLRSYTATQLVTYTNAETTPLNDVYFRLFPNSEAYGGQMTITSLRVNGQDAKPVYELDNTAMRVELAQPLQPGQSIGFELAYKANVPTEEVEIGYNRFGLHDTILTLPGFFPLIPVYDDEGWNVEAAPPQGDTVFSDTSLFQVNISAPADQVVATSGVCKRAGHETVTVYHCVSGPMRDFMIAMSPDYQVTSDVIDGVKVNSYYREESADEGQRGLEVVADAVRTYNQRIGEYPFNELDLLGTPTTAGGIEYPGLMVIAEGLFERNPTFYESATAHEVAHQWWYSLVGNDQIDEPWLDEALTQFTTALYFRDKYGVAGMNGYIESLQSRYKRVKGTADDKRADLPVADYDEGQYGALVYGKAALFFNAIYEAIGPEKFNHLLQDYFSQHRYGVAYPQDFLKVAEGYVGKAKLDELLKEWIETP
jgi:aminopeptidase N